MGRDWKRAERPLRHSGTAPALHPTDLSQNSKVRLQSGRIEAPNGRASRPVAGRLLHSQLEDFLADHDEPRRASGFPDLGVHRAGNSSAQPTREGETNAGTSRRFAFSLPHQTCATGRLLGACRRFPAREPRNLERHVAPNRHRTRFFDRSGTCG